jgi:hypothetical protein
MSRRSQFNSTILAIGDLVVFLAFPVLGASTHDGALSVDTLLRTTLPFAIAWAVVAPLMGAYAPRVTNSLRRVVPRTLMAWAIAGPLALLGRIWLLDRPFELSFILVVLGVVGLLLVVWRAIYVMLPTTR